MSENKFKKFPKKKVVQIAESSRIITSYEPTPEEWRGITAQKLREIANDPEEWVDRNELQIAQHYGYGTDLTQITFEDIIQFFIQTELLEALE